jgi:hypothetical protein
MVEHRTSRLSDALGTVREPVAHQRPLGGGRGIEGVFDKIQRKCEPSHTVPGPSCGISIDEIEREGALSGNMALAVYAGVYAWGRSHPQPCKLGITLRAYLALGGPLFAQGATLTHQPVGGLTATGRIAHVQLLTIGMVVWLMHRQTYLTPRSTDPPRFSAQITNCLIAVLIAVGICFVFYSGTEARKTGTGRDLRIILSSVPLCAAAAFFRDHWAGDASRPGWLRRVEAAGMHICNGTRDWLALFRRTVSFPAPFAAGLEACRPDGDDEHDRPDYRQLCAGSFSPRSSYGR